MYCIVENSLVCLSIFLFLLIPGYPWRERCDARFPIDRICDSSDSSDSSVRLGELHIPSNWGACHQFSNRPSSIILLPPNNVAIIKSFFRSSALPTISYSFSYSRPLLFHPPLLQVDWPETKARSLLAGTADLSLAASIRSCVKAGPSNVSRPVVQSSSRQSSVRQSPSALGRSVAQSRTHARTHARE